MAECPNCLKKLKPWHIKAECPFCGVNIPNYNWEERLEQDSVRSVAAFEMLGMRKDNVKTSLFSSKLVTVKFICTFLPLLLLVLPVCKAQISLPFISGEKSFSILNIVLWIVQNDFDFGAVLSLIKAPVTGGSFVMLYVSLALLVLSVLIAVISFFCLLIRSLSLGGRLNIVCNVMSLLCITASAVLLPRFFTEMNVMSINFASGFSFGICLFAGIAIYLLNTVLAALCEKYLAPKRTAFFKHRAELKSQYKLDT